MARTRGQGNPIWSRDETILALELYHQLANKAPSKRDARIRKLSEFLKRLPYDGNRPRNETYRNVDGVVFKLMNLRAAASGKGLKHVSLIDRTVWKELGNKPQEVRELAERIRVGAVVTQAISDGDDDEESFNEGGTVTRAHKTKERSRKLRNKLLRVRREKGLLHCDMCFMKPRSQDEKVQDAEFEAHHVVPISLALERKTRLKDMALLCANCHKLIHRLIALEKRWFDIGEASQKIGL